MPSRHALLLCAAQPTGEEHRIRLAREVDAVASPEQGQSYGGYVGHLPVAPRLNYGQQVRERRPDGEQKELDALGAEVQLAVGLTPVEQVARIYAAVDEPRDNCCGKAPDEDQRHVW